MMVPFVVYAYFDSFIQMIDSCEGNPQDSFTRQYQMHKPSSFCYCIKCFNNKIYLQDPSMYTVQHEDGDIAQMYIDAVEENIEIIYVRFDEPKIQSSESKIQSSEWKKNCSTKNATRCWICGGKFSNEIDNGKGHFQVL